MNLAEDDCSKFKNITDEIDAKSEAKRGAAADLNIQMQASESKASENVSRQQIDNNNSFSEIRQDIKGQNGAVERDLSSGEISKINSEGQVDEIQENVSNGGTKMAKVLTLGTGGDNQAHVTRPRTAKAGQPSDSNRKLKSVTNQLETITEKAQAEEGIAVLSQRLDGFDIEGSHSFTLRNFGKERQSNPYMESMKADLEGGKESGMSNYSKIYADSYQQKSQRDCESSARSGKNSPGRLIGNGQTGTRNIGKTLSRARLSKHLLNSVGGPYDDNESNSQASHNQPLSKSLNPVKIQQPNENLETMESQDDRKPGAM